MNARHGSLAVSHNVLMAVAAGAVLWTSQTARAEGGTIHFAGAIVAPTFGIAPTRVERVEGPAASDRFDSATRIATVNFTNASTSTLLAEVSTLDVRGAGENVPPAHLAVAFTDGAGHRLTRDAGGGYRVGPSGGVLTLTPAPVARHAEPARVTVLTDYR